LLPYSSWVRRRRHWQPASESSCGGKSGGSSDAEFRGVDVSPFTSVADLVGSASFVNFFHRSGVQVHLAFAFDGLAETAGAVLQ
jgi:hypothetical protein